jgi:hypothetical protein
MREILLWSALAIGLSASWVDLARHSLDEPWARPVALFPVLFVAAFLRDHRRRRAWHGGTLLVATGLALSLFAVGGGVDRLGRPGIPIAVTGMALALGRPSLATALLACWWIPPPAALSKALAPGLESGLAWIAARAAEAQGLSAVATPHALEIGGAKLELVPMDGGLPLAVYLAGVGWWGALHAGGGIREAFGAALRGVPLALAAQALGLGLAFASLASGGASAARMLLDLWPWPVLAIGVLRAESARRSATGARALPRSPAGNRR